MTKIRIPSPQQFCTSIPLYDEYEFEGEGVWRVANIVHFHGNYDSYCIECKKESTFQVTSRSRPPNLDPERDALIKKLSMTNDHPRIEPGIYVLTGACSRISSHTQTQILLILSKTTFGPNMEIIERMSIQKIGQHPSYGDINIAAIQKYARTLTRSQLTELSRAIALASHDVGIGAYVYLRRVFESLIEQAHKEATSNSNWDEENYQKSRMNEKISMLKDHLPSFIIEHPRMYSLLSKGVHELTEKECLEHFETLRISIEMTLDEKLEAVEKRKKREMAKSALEKSANALSEGSSTQSSPSEVKDLNSN